ncbi:MAG: hypothetical protein JXL97_11645 [Bacteroidales bacterium]|nr:hypothetical protein [Bacteroidales bacterium]
MSIIISFFDSKKWFMLVKILVFSIFFLSTFNIAHGMGISDWSYTTKNGSTISDSDPIPGVRLCLKKGEAKELYDLQKWYFYKNSIIGVYGERKIHEYFIANELTGELTTYTNRKEWKKQIKQKKLKPKIWTNWHKSHYPSEMFIFL